VEAQPLGPVVPDAKLDARLRTPTAPGGPLRLYVASRPPDPTPSARSPSAGSPLRS
jgi:hypothetical protein